MALKGPEIIWIVGLLISFSGTIISLIWNWMNWKARIEDRKAEHERRINEKKEKAITDVEKSLENVMGVLGQNPITRVQNMIEPAESETPTDKNGKDLNVRNIMLNDLKNVALAGNFESFRPTECFRKDAVIYTHQELYSKDFISNLYENLMQFQQLLTLILHIRRDNDIKLTDVPEDRLRFLLQNTKQFLLHFQYVLHPNPANQQSQFVDLLKRVLNVDNFLNNRDLRNGTYTVRTLLDMISVSAGNWCDDETLNLMVMYTKETPNEQALSKSKETCSCCEICICFPRRRQSRNYRYNAPCGSLLKAN